MSSRISPAGGQAAADQWAAEATATVQRDREFTNLDTAPSRVEAPDDAAKLAIGLVYAGESGATPPEIIALGAQGPRYLDA